MGADTASVTVPRLAALVRLLLQLRMMLAALALLLMPAERLSLTLIIALAAFALLSGLAARFWERLVPYLRSHPLLVALDVGAASGMLAIDGPSGPVFITTVLTAAIAGVLFGGRGTAAVVTLQLLCYVVAVLGYAGTRGESAIAAVTTFQVLLAHPLLYPLAGYIGARVRAILTELAAEQEARRRAEGAAAAAEERNRLARDMHDSVAKTLRGAAMAAQALPAWVERDPARAVAVSTQVVEATELAAAEARTLISGLREEPEETPFGLLVTTAVVEWRARSGVHAVARVPEREVALSATARREGLAVLREALTNVERHAGAGSVRVTLSVEEGCCLLAIADDGAGFARPPEEVRAAEREGHGHYGVLGMAERAERAGGSLEIASTPGEGSEVRLRLPITEHVPEDGEAPR